MQNAAPTTIAASSHHFAGFAGSPPLVAVRRAGIDLGELTTAFDDAVFGLDEAALRAVGLRAVGLDEAALRAFGLAVGVCAVRRRVEPWVERAVERRCSVVPDGEAARCGRGPGRGRVPVTSTFLDMYYDFPSAWSAGPRTSSTNAFVKPTRRVSACR